MSVSPQRPRRRQAEVSLGLGIRPCVSCLWGEGGRRACLTAVSCWNQGVINTISLLRLPPPRSLPPPAGLKNKQAQEAQGRGAGARGRLAAGRAGPAGEPRGTGGHAWAHGHTRTATGAGARSDPGGPLSFSVALSDPQFPHLFHGDNSTLFTG